MYQENYNNLLSGLEDSMFPDGQTSYYKHVNYIHSFMLIYKLNTITVKKKNQTGLFLELDKMNLKSILKSKNDNEVEEKVMK